MSRKQTLQVFSQNLHISHSQIFTYSACSLKYFFQYVEQRQPERISIALPFGKAIHAALEMYYRALKKGGPMESLSDISERFEVCLSLDLNNPNSPVIFKKDTPDKAGAIAMGKAMLKAFYETIDLSAHEIIGVELPLSATLYTDTGEATDFQLVGIVDLLLRDDAGQIIVIDNKTAAKPISQSAADENSQMTVYSYLLGANKYVFPTADVKCRFDVLRKLKSPKFEQVSTIRTAEQRKRFAKIANMVLAGIDAQIFIPQPSWMCNDCAYINACKAW